MIIQMRRQANTKIVLAIFVSLRRSLSLQLTDSLPSNSEDTRGSIYIFLPRCSHLPRKVIQKESAMSRRSIRKV
jgi:hypothetical protein